MLLLTAALFLMIAIIIQNIMYPPLREDTISDGLYQEVPTYWTLDLTYAFLCIALVLAFWDQGDWARLLSCVTAASLAITAFSNTCSVWIDKVTHGLHNKIHTSATIAMFLSVIALETELDHGWFWWLTAAGVGLPIALYAVLAKLKTKLLPGPAAEKLAVALLCGWMIAWDLVH
jgi:hypothetical protein